MNLKNMSADELKNYRRAASAAHRERQRKKNPPKWRWGSVNLKGMTPEQRRIYYRLHSAKHTANKNNYRIIDISLEEAEAALQSASVCEVCGTAGRLVLDHCHESGKFRGVVCHPCNLGMGNFEDRADLLEQAAAYLRRKALS
ncbi:MAG: hypothetical protein KGL39_41550 [Patescibacteria group bacterium]|nr:hypothetical protein [Patescibacteria group bacterium]